MIATMTQTMNSPLSGQHVGNPVTQARQLQQVNSTKNPEYYNNVKYEDIISKPLKPSYDGSAEHLIPFLNRLDI